MSKYSHLLLSFLLLLLAGGCADEFQWQGTSVAEDEYLIAFTTAAPQVELVSGTRADDPRDGIDNLALVIFGNDGKLFDTPQYFTAGTEGYTAPVGEGSGSIVVKRRTVADGKWYLIANAKTEIDEYLTANGTNVSEEDFLNGIKYGKDQLTGTSKHVMIANQANINIDAAQTTAPVFALGRIYSRVSVEMNKDKMNFIMTEARLSRYAAQGTLALGQNNAIGTDEVSDTEGWRMPTTVVDVAGSTTVKAAAKNAQILTESFPFAPAEDAASNEKILMLVKGFYNKSGNPNEPEFNFSEPCYYAIPVPAIAANHHYKILINAADAPGTSSAKLAEEKPGGLSVEFQDQTSEIHNIISDGENVLAVPDTVRIASGYNRETNSYADPQWSFPIKARKSSTEAPNVIIKKVGNEPSDWFPAPEDFTLTHTNISQTPESQAGLFSTSIDVKGIAKANKGSEREVTYTVTLEGTELSRTVVFLQEANEEVKYTDAVSVKLEIMRGEDNIVATINDYMRFINPSVSSATTGETCFGVQPSENGGRIRNLGLHAPMPNDGVTYKYTVTPKDGVKIDGVHQTKEYIFKDSEVPTSGSTKYSYVTKPDYAVITAGENTVYVLDFYHTGFFHKASDGWYYYEVVRQDDKDLYWLDRNLGAKSAGMGVRNGSNTMSGNWPITGDKAMGERYNVGDATDACPAGWRIPSFAQMRSLTVSAGFSINRMATANNATYFAPAYQFNGSDNGVAKLMNIYFPANMMLHEGNVSGDYGAGYYLTTTSAGSAGWYQTMQFCGMNVTSQNTDMNKSKMSVRCCAGTYNPSTEATTYKCNVKGYTHVFMYHLNSDGSKTYLTTWPGDQICMYNDNELGRYHPFEITPTMNYDISRIYVIFNAVKDGETLKSNVSTTNAQRREGIRFVANGNYDDTASTVAEGAAEGNWVTIAAAEYEYAIKGSMNNKNWAAASQKFVKQADGTWIIKDWEVTSGGEFVIQRKKTTSSSWSDWGNHEDQSKPAIVNGEMYTISPNKGSGYNWSINTGTHTIVLDPESLTMKVTIVGGVTPKYLVIRTKTSGINDDQKYCYVWNDNGSQKYFGDYNAAPMMSGTKGEYRYWRQQVSSEVTALSGVIFKAAANGDGAHKTEIKESSKIHRETGSALLEEYDADYMFTIDVAQSTGPTDPTDIPAGKAKIVLYKKPNSNWSGNVCLEVENSQNQKSGWGQAISQRGTVANHEVYEVIVEPDVWNVNVNNGSNINNWCVIDNGIGAGNTVYIEFDSNSATKTTQKN